MSSVDDAYHIGGKFNKELFYKFIKDLKPSDNNNSEVDDWVWNLVLKKAEGHEFNIKINWRID